MRHTNHIQSFSRRQGRITTAQQKALKTLWPKYGLEINSNAKQFETLSKRQPLKVEIGFGDGQNLIQMAMTEPHNMYIGIDVYRPGIGRLLIELNRLDIDNVKIILGDAVESLPLFFKENSISDVMIFFPDPWPKKRHHKRRLITRDFLKKIAFYLSKNGNLYISTDCEQYAEGILSLIDKEDLLENVSGYYSYAEQQFRVSLTKYELRGLRLGHTIRNIHSRRLCN